MTGPTVTVIIPTCNRADLVGTAVASALSQTLRELEVIVVDDASDDQTAAVMSRFSDPRLKFLRQPSRLGAPAARNRAIRSSTSEFVAFLDDDDTWRPEKLERQVALFRRSGPEVGVVYSSYAIVDRETGAVIGRKVASKRGFLKVDLLVRNHIGATSCVLVRRDALHRAGLWDERMPSFQDYDLWIRLSKDWEFDFVEQDLLDYSVHAKKIWTNLGALDRGIALMVEKHGSSPTLRRSLSNQSLGVGVGYCSEGRMGSGRKAILRAIRLHPTAPRPWLNFGLSLLGASAFRAVHEAKRKIESAGKVGLSGAAANPVRREGER